MFVKTKILLDLYLSDVQPQKHCKLIWKKRCTQHFLCFCFCILNTSRTRGPPHMMAFEALVNSGNCFSRVRVYVILDTASATYKYIYDSISFIWWNSQLKTVPVGSTSHHGSTNTKEAHEWFSQAKRRLKHLHLMTVSRLLPYFFSHLKKKKLYLTNLRNVLLLKNWKN